MNVLNNQLSQNWKNYQSGIKPSNPLKEGIVRKMGGKRIGVIPNNLNSGRQMTFTTSKRNNFSNSHSVFANFATLYQDMALGGASIPSLNSVPPTVRHIKRSGAAIKDAELRAKGYKKQAKKAAKRKDYNSQTSYTAKSTVQQSKADYYRSVIKQNKDIIAGNAQLYSNTPYNQKARAEKFGRMYENAYKAAPPPPPKPKPSVEMPTGESIVNDIMNKKPQPKKTNSFLTKRNAAIGGAGVLAGGLGLYLANRNKEEAQYGYMCEIIEFAPSDKKKKKTSAGALPRFSQLTPQQKKQLTPQELEYLRKKEEEDTNFDKNLRTTASKRASYRAGLDTAREGRGWINSATAIGRESRSWLKFLGLEKETRNALGLP